MFPKSNLIKDLDGKIYLLDKLYLGEKVEALPQEVKDYDMNPQAGYLKKEDGSVISEVDLILEMANSGSKVDLSNYYTKEETGELLLKKANAEDVYTKEEIDKIISSNPGGGDNINTPINFDRIIVVRKKDLPSENINDGTVVLDTFNRRTNSIVDKGDHEPDMVYYYTIFVLNGLDEVGNGIYVKTTTITNFAGIRIVRKEDIQPVNHEDGLIILDTKDVATQTFRDFNVEKNKTYYYTLFVYNSNGEYNKGTSVKVVTPPPLNFKGMKIIRKENSEPVNIKDGEVIFSSENTNISEIKDNLVEIGKTYYYKIYLYNENNEVDNGTAIKVVL